MATLMFVGVKMKLKKIEIENFKGLKHFEMDLHGANDMPRSLTCLVGNNGSGKSTVLQAIALVLSAATRKNEDITSHAGISSLPWNGFISERSISHSTKIKLELELEPDEITATQEVFEIWKHYYHNLSDNFAKPETLTDITLLYEFGQVKCLEGEATLLWGRFYINTLLEAMPEVRRFCSRIGDVFWFDQYRNLATTKSSTDWANGISSIRQSLMGWWMYHKSEYKTSTDILVDLEKSFNIFFPKTRFVGVEPMKGGADIYQPDFFFLLQRGDSKPYDISEMSSGEQVIFSMLYQFISLNIARSILLIDELELHLHAPLQQGLSAALYQLAPDCQFILTTHSAYLEEVFLNNEFVFMERL
jgi:predicted ATPase